jgi:hypothetical protein
MPMIRLSSPRLLPGNIATGSNSEGTIAKK